jgi:hypothetical protein
MSMAYCLKNTSEVSNLNNLDKFCKGNEVYITKLILFM